MGVEVIVTGAKVAYGCFTGFFVLAQSVDKLKAELCQPGGVSDRGWTTWGVQTLAEDVEDRMKAGSRSTKDA